MSDATAMLKDLAEPWRPGEFVKDVLARVAPLAGLTHSRAFEIWYARARRIEVHEIANIAAAIAKKNKRAVWNEIHDLKIRMAKLEAVVGGSSEDFGRPASASDRPLLRVAGGADRSGSRGGR